jgi:mono/diheme cytochrome c family protein
VFRNVGGRAAVCALAVFAGAFLVRQSQNTKPSGKESAVREGASLYKRECAVCHGNDGTGGGAPPRSSQFTTPAPDLTTLSKRHGGNFPAAYVDEVLRSGVKMADHGPAEMPVWGAIFKATTKSDEAEVNKRIAALTVYLQSRQAK